MKRCYLFDLDGTVANGDHRLHHIQKQPKDWRAFFAECHLDSPIPHIIEVARALWCYGVEIVYVSGRSDECRELTLSWMEKNDLPPGPLYMRAAGDHRNDDVLKIELLARIRADGYEPVMAFDDRARAVRAFRDAGIPVAQVNDGEF